VLTVITGPPCSGKTSYLRQHAQPGDIVIDFDVLAQALGSPDTHEHPDPIRYVTTVARRAAVDAAVRQHVTKGAVVWIVDSSPGERRTQLYEDAGAEWVTLSVDRDELHRRAHAERPKRWHKIIDEWKPQVRGSTQVEGSRSW
jgi:hypothetical protein